MNKTIELCVKVLLIVLIALMLAWLAFTLSVQAVRLVA